MATRAVSRRGWLAAVVLIALLGSSACAGQDSAPTTSTPSVHPTPTQLTAPVVEKLPLVGECFDSHKVIGVECTQPHDAEVTWLEALPPHLPAAYPDNNTLLAASIPLCQRKLTDYLGSPAAPASRLRVSTIWPNKQLWETGQHYVICTVVELGDNGRPVMRTGTLRDALKNDFARYQLCTVGQPQQPELPTSISCTQPHSGEALPEVLDLGKSSTLRPALTELNKTMDKHCRAAANNYLAAPQGRKDVTVHWRIPTEIDWPQGYTIGTCFIEPAKQITKPLNGIGPTAPLPS